jgi:hypothetical protein
MLFQLQCPVIINKIPFGTSVLIKKWELPIIDLENISGGFNYENYYKDAK